ncbi:uncharacterized protein MONOS_16955 [Monocercomonoides exilis]|uniref:uncharacterized protein n=1 Tax=Monocercomonoides exilis TaxID=2049356 RepID=UPI003559F240|nr:hypothetical protein MONOS_16955 [Monocercomonoides exilis]
MKTMKQKLSRQPSSFIPKNGFCEANGTHPPLQPCCSCFHPLSITLFTQSRYAHSAAENRIIIDGRRRGGEERGRRMSYDNTALLALLYTLVLTEWRTLPLQLSISQKIREIMKKHKKLWKSSYGIEKEERRSEEPDY